MTLDELNNCSTDQARKWFEQSCSAKNWVAKMVEARPFNSKRQIKNYSQFVWRNLLETNDYLEAFKGHPMIGDLNSLKQKYANTLETAGQEQSGTSIASEELLSRLKTLNARYYQKNGFIFIICATGLSAQTMLEQLEKRIDNNTEQEITIASAEQNKITLLRLEKFLDNARVTL